MSVASLRGSTLTSALFASTEKAPQDVFPVCRNGGGSVERAAPATGGRTAVVRVVRGQGWGGRASPFPGTLPNETPPDALSFPFKCSRPPVASRYVGNIAVSKKPNKEVHVALQPPPRPPGPPNLRALGGHVEKFRQPEIPPKPLHLPLRKGVITKNNYGWSPGGKKKSNRQPRRWCRA